MINIQKLKSKLQEIVCPQMPELCDIISSQDWCLGNTDKLQSLADNLNSLLSQVSQDELLDIADKIVDIKHGDLAQILIYLISNVPALNELMEGTQLDEAILAKRNLLKNKIAQQMIFKNSIVKYGCQSLLLELKAYLESQGELSPEDQKILDQVNELLS